MKVFRSDAFRVFWGKMKLRLKRSENYIRMLFVHRLHVERPLKSPALFLALFYTGFVVEDIGRSPSVI